MTKAEIILAVRNLVQELSTDSGTLLSDAANMTVLVDDAVEQVVLDLIDFMPEQFLTSETINLVAGTANYTLTTLFYQVYKVEKNVTGDAPREIQIINQIQKPGFMNVGETDAEPKACYFLGDTIYFVPTPATTTANYARAWLVRSEPATMATAGPTYIPAPAHRLIVYRAASLIATILESNPTNFDKLYNQRLAMVRQAWIKRYRSQPRYVNQGIEERAARSGRDSAFYDRDWD